MTTILTSLHKLEEIFEKYNIFNFTLEKFVMRVIASYALVNTFFIGLTPDGIPVTSKESVIPTNFLSTAGYIFLVFVLTTGAFAITKTALADKLFLFLSVSAFNITAMFQVGNNDYLFIFLMIFQAICCYFCFNKLDKELNIPTFAVKIGYIATAVSFTVFLGLILAFRYLTFMTPNFDFGIFVQMFYYMKETGLPLTTCERDTLLSHFAVHASPIYYLILPFYCIFQSPITINVSQAFILALGFIPLYLLCKHKNLSNGITLLFAVIYTFYPAVMAGTFYDIHENVFLTPFLLFLLYFIEKDKTVGIFVMMVLTLAIKEDAAVYIIFIAIYMILAKKMYLKGGIMLALSTVYFLVIVHVLNTYGDGAMTSRYVDYEINGTGLDEVIKVCITSPLYVFAQCATLEKLLFIMKMLLPLGFLPMLSKKASNFVLFAPFMIINLISNYQYQHSLDFQYNFGVVAIFLYLSICNISELNIDKQRMMTLFSVVACISLFMSVNWHRTIYFKYYKDYGDTYRAVEQSLEEHIPEDAEIAINTFLLPHACERKVCYQLTPTNPEFEKRVEFLVFDIRFQEFIDQYNAYLLEGSYEHYYSDENIAILRYIYYEAQ